MLIRTRIITYSQSAIHCCYFAFWVIGNFLLLLGSHIIMSVVHLFVLHPWLCSKFSTACFHLIIMYFCSAADRWKGWFLCGSWRENQVNAYHLFDSLSERYMRYHIQQSFVNMFKEKKRMWYMVLPGLGITLWYNTLPGFLQR